MSPDMAGHDVPGHDTAAPGTTKADDACDAGTARCASTATRWAFQTPRQIPKKDSMGMDYLPVYEGEDSDDGTS